MALRPRVRSTKNVIVKDLGLGRILQELNKADHSFTKIGFPAEGEVGEQTRGGSEHEPAIEISEVAEVAIYHEFGTVHIPSRAFVRPSFDENISENDRLRDKLYKKIVDGKMTTKQALGLIGEFNVGKMKRKIRSIKSPPLKPATIRRKKGAKQPLIDTAQMINSVQHVEVISGV